MAAREIEPILRNDISGLNDKIVRNLGDFTFAGCPGVLDQGWGLSPAPPAATYVLASTFLLARSHRSKQNRR